MQETVGTLNLKIAQLEQTLRVLQQRQVLSMPYPGHRANLMGENLQTQTELLQLIQARTHLIQRRADSEGPKQ